MPDCENKPKDLIGIDYGDRLRVVFSVYFEKALFHFDILDRSEQHKVELLKALKDDGSCNADCELTRIFSCVQYIWEWIHTDKAVALSGIGLPLFVLFSDLNELLKGGKQTAFRCNQNLNDNRTYLNTFRAMDGWVKANTHAERDIGVAQYEKLILSLTAATNHLRSTPERLISSTYALGSFLEFLMSDAPRTAKLANSTTLVASATKDLRRLYESCTKLLSGENDKLLEGYHFGDSPSAEVGGFKPMFRVSDFLNGILISAFDRLKEAGVLRCEAKKFLQIEIERAALRINGKPVLATKIATQSKKASAQAKGKSPTAIVLDQAQAELHLTSRKKYEIPRLTFIARNRSSLITSTTMTMVEITEPDLTSVFAYGDEEELADFLVSKFTKEKLTSANVKISEVVRPEVSRLLIDVKLLVQTVKNYSYQ